MKSMIVTGLSNEQDFASGESRFILILNKEFRVPVSEELAAKIIEEMYKDSKTTTPEIETSNNQSSYSDDDEVDQI